MKKQFILAGAGIIAITLLFFFGRTTEKKSPITNVESVLNTQTFDIQRFIESSKQNLTPAQVLIVTKLENGISRGDVPAQQLQAYNSLANFWKDTAKLFEPYLFYVSKAAKLDNSEKSLTFAAQIFLEALRGEQDNSKLDWETSEAISLFENAIKLNPENDDLRIGLGSCYIYGKGRSGNPEQTMKGIQELLGVARRDSNNMKAQVVLGVGGLVSGQFDKALERFQKVVNKEPGNLEAIAYLADTYAAKGNKAEAIKWYTLSKRLANNPHYTEEVDKRIQSLK
ncbi:MAG: tetratricopeptide repeat protein [Ferruginibacter sp.]|nr:tetratricopeptide repeat protein [Ferruginibacter sp.]